MAVMSDHHMVSKPGLEQSWVQIYFSPSYSLPVCLWIFAYPCEIDLGRVLTHKLIVAFFVYLLGHALLTVFTFKHCADFDHPHFLFDCGNLAAVMHRASAHFVIDIFMPFVFAGGCESCDMCDLLHDPSDLQESESEEDILDEGDEEVEEEHDQESEVQVPPEPEVVKAREVSSAPKEAEKQLSKKEKKKKDLAEFEAILADLRVEPETDNAQGESRGNCYAIYCL